MVAVFLLKNEISGVLSDEFRNPRQLKGMCIVFIVHVTCNTIL